jgi:hypothetical protein
MTASPITVVKQSKCGKSLAVLKYFKQYTNGRCQCRYDKKTSQRRAFARNQNSAYMFRLLYLSIRSCLNYTAFIHFFIRES